jgi:heptosyltransferase III
MSRTTLVVHPGALGDVLQAVPAMRALSRRGAVVFSGQPRIGELLRGLGVVSAHTPFDGFGLEALFARGPIPAALVERLGRFQRVISWFGSRDGTYTERLRSTAADCVIAAPVGPSGQPVWRHLLATAGETTDPELVEPLQVPEAWRRDAGSTLGALGAVDGRPLLVLHPGAGGQWKRWSTGEMAAAVERVIDETGARVLIHEGPADAETAAEISGLLRGPAPRLVEPGLPLLAAVLAGASAYAGADSGVSQLAAAVGAPAVILYPGATREEWAPWSRTAFAVSVGSDKGHAAAIAAALIRRIQGEAAASADSGS